MINFQKEFYFIRHGQTEHHYDDPNIGLNATGISQAHHAKKILSNIQLQSVCYSPLKRATETRDILFEKYHNIHHEISDLEECTSLIWKSMVNSDPVQYEKKEQFIQRAVNGINLSLSKPSPTLIIAHGGIHYAFCKYHSIQNYNWVIDNCVLVHFKLIENKWYPKIIR
jgi:probable phosphoglycerate mutase